MCSREEGKRKETRRIRRFRNTTNICGNVRKIEAGCGANEWKKRRRRNRVERASRSKRNAIWLQTIAEGNLRACIAWDRVSHFCLQSSSAPSTWHSFYIALTVLVLLLPWIIHELWVSQGRRGHSRVTWWEEVHDGSTQCCKCHLTFNANPLWKLVLLSKKLLRKASTNSLIQPKKSSTRCFFAAATGETGKVSYVIMGLWAINNKKRRRQTESW